LRTLLELLATGRVWLKLSAFYRASNDAPRHADLAALARTLIATRPQRLLWGSDWPHTGGGRDRDPARIEPFRQVDLPASLLALQSWVPDAAVLHRILVSNPAELYGFAADAA
jgi:predicted TIM-barrel fold metal-dependent hydrolase